MHVVAVMVVLVLVPPLSQIYVLIQFFFKYFPCLFIATFFKKNKAVHYFYAFYFVLSLPIMKSCLEPLCIYNWDPIGMRLLS